jgi:hypothetical protein
MRRTYILSSMLLGVILTFSLSAAGHCDQVMDQTAAGHSDQVMDQTAAGHSDQVMDRDQIRRILQQADEARGNLQGVQWRVSIVVGKDDENNKMAYEVKARGFDTLATSMLPAKDKGNKVLMVDGNMWFYKTGLSKPVPIARRQKLMGNAAYGDIASTNYDEDYTAKPLPDETVQDIPCYVFDLRAKTTQATYDRIKYWISKKDSIGVQAEYYTVSGKMFKSAVMHYDNHVAVKDHRRPFISEINIQDDIMGGDHTILTFKEPKIGKIPDYVFNLNLLRR